MIQIHLVDKPTCVKCGKHIDVTAGEAFNLSLAKLESETVARVALTCMSCLISTVTGEQARSLARLSMN